MRKNKILIIEDETELLNVLTMRLRSAGFEVVGAQDGGKGLRALKKQRPDLLILDLVLPMVSGVDILRSIKKGKDTAGLPVIVLTAQFIDSKLENQLKSYDLVKIIQKPYEPEGLVREINDFMYQ